MVPALDSISISGHEEIERRLIDGKPENENDHQHSQWKERSLRQESGRFEDDKDWDEAYIE